MIRTICAASLRQISRTLSRRDHDATRGRVSSLFKVASPRADTVEELAAGTQVKHKLRVSARVPIQDLGQSRRSAHVEIMRRLEEIM
jgi:hypothetical protein